VVQLTNRWFRVKEFLSVLFGLGLLVAENKSGPAILKKVLCLGI